MRRSRQFKVALDKGSSSRSLASILKTGFARKVRAVRQRSGWCPVSIRAWALLVADQPDHREASMPSSAGPARLPGQDLAGWKAMPVLQDCLGRTLPVGRL